MEELSADDPSAVIALRALTKRYRGGQLAVDGIDPSVSRQAASSPS